MEDLNVYREKGIVDARIDRMDGIARPLDTAKSLLELLWMEFELSRITAGWIPASDHYDTKAMLARLAYLHARHTMLLHDRINELPGSFKGTTEHEPGSIRELFERLAMAESISGFFWSYRYTYRQVCDGYRALIERLDPILEAPTLDQIQILLSNESYIVEYLNAQLKFAFVDQQKEKLTIQKLWESYVKKCWEKGVRAAHEQESSEAIQWPPHPVEHPAGPAPAEAVPDPEYPLYVNDVNEGMKSFSDPEASPLFQSVKQMHYINACEMAAVESLAYMYYGVSGMPLEFHYDAARHLWDESRHSLMGIRRLKQLGYDTKQFRWFRGAPGDLNAEDRFAEMYTSLTMVAEPCSFQKKRKSAEAFWKFGDSLSAVQSEYDVVDERLHVDFGTKWATELYKRIGELATVKELSERARLRRVRELKVSMEEQEKLIKNFPGFCGVSTSELAYDNY